MNEYGIALTLIGMGLVTLAVALFSVKGYGLLQVRWLNLSRLRQLRELQEKVRDPAEKRALEVLVTHCETLRSRWILRLDDLNVAVQTRALVTEIAQPFHPKASQPLERARIGLVLQAFLELKTHIQILTQMKGVQRLTGFRVRHVRALARAWDKKRQWDESRAGKAVERFKLFPALKWAWTAWQYLDLFFWSARMLKYLGEMLVFKIFLVRWYLLAGDLALQVYRDRAPEHDVSADDVLAELDALPPQEGEVPADLPEAVREITQRSRKRIMFRTRPLPWVEVRALYVQLTEDIAGYHYPGVERPLEEARLYDLLLSAARLAEQVVGLQSKPVISKILDLRFSHIMIVKDTTETILNHDLMELVKKYRVGQALKYSTLIYKAFKKGHPGVLFKDFAFTLAREAGKRWVYVYLHDRLATEANRVYGVEGENEK